MIYDVICNYFDNMCETIDIPEITSMLRNWFNIEEDEKNEILAEHLRNLFSLDCYEIRDFVESLEIDYSSLIIISRNIDPDFWTSQTVRMIQNKHLNLLNELDSDGKLRSKNRSGNIEKNKLVLLRYFDLLPEEENHDKELSVLLLRSLKNQEKLVELLTMTEINIVTLIKISMSIQPSFWATLNGKQLKNKLLKFNSIDL